MAKAAVTKSKKLSELERNAVELLVQLSGSSSAYSDSDLGDTKSNGTGEDEGKSRAPPDRRFDDQALSSSSSSKYKLLLSEDGDEYDEEILGARKKRKFRSVSELYELTEPLSLLVAKNRKRKTSGD